MMGLEERDVSICFTTLPACVGGFLTLNEIALPIVPHGNDQFHPCGQNEFKREAPFDLVDGMV
jgi:hypothetical protein